MSYQVYIIHKGYRPRKFSVSLEATVLNRLRGMGADVIVVFGRHSEALEKCLGLCTLSRGGDWIIIDQDKRVKSQ